MIVAIKIMVIENRLLVTQYVGNQNFGNGKICGDHKMWQQKILWRLKKMVTKKSD
jgi:hypothetical protein